MFNSGPSSRLGEAPRIVISEYTFQRNCLGNSTPGSEDSLAHEYTERRLRLEVHLESMDDKNRYPRADKIRNYVYGEADISSQGSHVRG